MGRKLTIGVIAHVDAGKTTLSEALLYLSGKIRSPGRVDHKNTFLDVNPMERQRGITIFSKQARFSYGDVDFILLDTPGHVDFSAETERTLSLLDYAVLVVSAPDGVQNHTRTLWQLLELYRVPTFIFVNKTDICPRRLEEVENELVKSLSPHCAAFFERMSAHELWEKLAMTCEEMLDSYTENGQITDDEIAAAISRRRLFPCFFGSALKLEGITATAEADTAVHCTLLDALTCYTLQPIYENGEFGARVYKISRATGARLTYMKIYSGALNVRDEIRYTTPDGATYAEKVAQIRLYSGEKFEQTDSAAAGEICAVTGLSATYAGQGLGSETDGGEPVLEPVLSYRVLLPIGCDPMKYFPLLKQLEEEEPSLHLCWNDKLSQIEARLMGDIQTDLLCNLIHERFSIHCVFDAGRILYKERIAAEAVGVGHFEPLRHYAEVQLLMEPLPEGTGLIFDTDLPANSPDTNWQRLILSNLYEKEHRGTLIGAELTDTKITLIAGRAHQKHTEGGDFREAACRAVRQGLMKAGCVLLEPYYKFRLELPSVSVGRAMADLQTMSAQFDIESSDGEISVIVGRGPVSELHKYTAEVISYTHGKGRLNCISDGYFPCHNQDEIVAAAGYDPQADLENPPHSVFCDHGAGFVVPWNEVDKYKHIDVQAQKESLLPTPRVLARKYSLSDEELEAIMLKEFGPIRRKRYSEARTISAEKTHRKPSPKNQVLNRRMLIVDGYNIIYSWENLKATAQQSLEDARDALMDILANYAAYTKAEITLVFDAYRVREGMGEEFDKNGIHVVYTKPDETADAYIERLMHKLGPDYTVRAVTGDRQVQYAAVHSGILRLSAREFEAEVLTVGSEIREFVRRLSQE